MKIGCIGWGSLIWKPDKLEVAGQWLNDGPFLPIEFSRISDNGRVTLIIDPGTNQVKTLWNVMSLLNLDEAMENLRQREGTIPKNIHHVTRGLEVTDPVKVIVKDWLLTTDLEAAIWTGLSYSTKTKKKRPSIDEVITHLQNLQDKAQIDAQEYIQRAPRQIVTEYRKVIENRLGWHSLP